MVLHDSASLPAPKTNPQMYLETGSIRDLYQSRTIMVVEFECIEPYDIHCTSESSEQIPRDIAHKLYGPNDAVTLLQTEETRLVLLDGNRCYKIWRLSVAKGELPRSVLLNVITDYEGLNSFQKLQLSIFCNVHSQFTRVETFKEKLTTCRAALTSYIGSLPCNDDHFSSVNRGSISSSLCDGVSEGLHMTTMFDDYLSLTKRAPPHHERAEFSSACVRTSIELKNYPELLSAMKHLFLVSDFRAGFYLHRQFFYDFAGGKFSSCSPLPNMVLFFVLASLPWNANSENTPEQVTLRNFRAMVRSSAVAICGFVSNFVVSLNKSIAICGCLICSQLPAHVPIHFDGPLCPVFAFEVSNGILSAAKDAEKVVLEDSMDSISCSIPTTIMDRTNELIVLRTEQESEKPLKDH